MSGTDILIAIFGGASGSMAMFIFMNSHLLKKSPPPREIQERNSRRG